MSDKKQFLYARLAEELREKILRGDVKPGEFLPSENELCNQYGISRISVRKSLEILAAEGLVVRRPGQGTMVSHPEQAPAASRRRTLHLFAISPSYYMELGMPLIVDAFVRDHPDVDVRVVNLPTSDPWEWKQALEDSGVKPDLLLLTESHYREIEQLEDYVPLTAEMRSHGGLFYPKLMEHFTHNYNLMAVPVTFSPVILAYNPHMLRESGAEQPAADWTLEQFREAWKRVTADTNGDGICDRYGLSLSSGFSRWSTLALQNSDSLSTLWENPSLLRKTLELIHQLLYEDKSALLVRPGAFRLGSEPFLQGKTAMVLTTAIELAAWRSKYLKFEPSIAPLAFGPHSSTLLMANALLLPKEAPNAELAAAFIRYSVRTDIQEQIARKAGFLSVLKMINDQVWTKEELTSMLVGDFFLEGGTFYYDQMRDKHWLEEWDETMRFFWYGLESVDQTIERMEKKR
ncbi:hypothetical protein J31TS4_47090 [Paenibacillus sp. J31TS4]|uniref:extracellular solute-binding protein n=1 Tax=Paenibacillus sp. J31TS4 TaxID=2807195 RepID=UPI001B1DA809|nr:extracellular solute-binding protein [Paenibacillus sp. J31TS4]GIP41429.1 hypothetical protein J31TS4_47090 [Paenibacillus sp. J31TS4]